MPVHHLARALPAVAALICSATILHGAGAPSARLHRLDPVLRFALESAAPRTDRGIPPNVGLLGRDGESLYPCWIRHDPTAPLPPELGLRTYGPGLQAGRLRREEILQLVGYAGVSAIESARQLRLLLDESVPEIGVDRVHAAEGAPPVYGGLTGAGVIVGIVDTGIDLSHPDFREDGRTRIIALWDQTVASLDPPVGFDYGREWRATEIEAGLASQQDLHGHGTQVAGVAAGSGAATGNGLPAHRFVGVAPRAELVVVKTDFYTTSIVDAVAYVFSIAEARGRPAVVNLSLGHQYGPHDGTEATDLALDALAGPGRLIVAAAGNEQDDGIHAEATLARGAEAEIVLDIPPYSAAPGAGNDLVLLDGYVTAGAHLAISVISPHGHVLGPVSASSSARLDCPDGSIHVENAIFDPATPDENVHLRIWDAAETDAPALGDWRIRIHRSEGSPVEGPVHLDIWLYHHTLAGAVPGFAPEAGGTARRLIASPASADSVIAVGAYVSRTSWVSRDGYTYAYNPAPPRGDIAPFSSQGPRRDGVIKPDVAAPGMGIATARSSSQQGSSAWILADDVHTVTQGTSVAAPHVTGVVALLLEAHGSISCRHVRERLGAAARRDTFTGAVPNPVFGAGKLDAPGAIDGRPALDVLQVETHREAGFVRLQWSVPATERSPEFLVERSVESGEKSTSGEERTPVGTAGPGPTYEFIDRNAPFTECRYWLTALPDQRPVLGPFDVPAVSSTNRLTLGRPAPTPFSDQVSLALTLAAPLAVRVEIVDVSGRRIVSLADGTLPAGTTALSWDGRTAEGAPAGSGLYFIRALGPGIERTARVLLVR